jgi:vacuolar-type H+-ATPase subunit I/STV1
VRTLSLAFILSLFSIFFCHEKYIWRCKYSFLRRSDTLKRKIEKPKHIEKLGQAKIKALKVLFIDKNLMPKISENSSARSGMADIRRTRNKRNKSIEEEADDLVNLVNVDWLLENLPKVPTDKITLSSSRRRGGRRKKTTRKKKKNETKRSAHKRK